MANLGGLLSPIFKRDQPLWMLLEELWEEVQFHKVLLERLQGGALSPPRIVLLEGLQDGVRSKSTLGDA